MRPSPLVMPMAAKKPAKKPSRKVAKKTTSEPARKSAKRPARVPAEEPERSSSPEEFTALITSTGDWRGETLAKLRRLIREAVPDVVEEIKWRKPSNPDGVPVWSYDGIICTGGAFKDKVKLTFAQGAALQDPKRVFNASLDAGTWRALDLREGDKLDEEAFRDLVRQAAARNSVGRAK